MAEGSKGLGNLECSRVDREFCLDVEHRRHELIPTPQAQKFRQGSVSPLEEIPNSLIKGGCLLVCSARRTCSQATNEERRLLLKILRMDHRQVHSRFFLAGFSSYLSGSGRLRLSH